MKKKYLFFLFIFISSAFLILYNSFKSSSFLNQAIEVDSYNYESSNDGKLIHIIGKISSEDTLRDPVFDIERKGIKIKRKVEMFQWVKIKRFHKTWLQDVFKHDDSEHKNSAPPFLSVEISAQKAFLGDFEISKEILDEINFYIPFTKNSNTLTGAIDSYRATLNLNGFKYYSASMNNPNLGDLRVSYEIVPYQIISIIASQKGKKIVPFHGEQGKFFKVLPGEKSVQDFINIVDR